MIILSFSAKHPQKIYLQAVQFPKGRDNAIIPCENATILALSPKGGS